jgi:hypothetical protein
MSGDDWRRDKANANGSGCGRPVPPIVRHGHTHSGGGGRVRQTRHLKFSSRDKKRPVNPVRTHSRAGSQRHATQRRVCARVVNVHRAQAHAEEWGIAKMGTENGKVGATGGGRNEGPYGGDLHLIWRSVTDARRENVFPGVP